MWTDRPNKTDILLSPIVDKYKSIKWTVESAKWTVHPGKGVLKSIKRTSFYSIHKVDEFFYDGSSKNGMNNRQIYGRLYYKVK